MIVIQKREQVVWRMAACGGGGDQDLYQMTAGQLHSYSNSMWPVQLILCQ
jgi:hypothetical protein